MQAVGLTFNVCCMFPSQLSDVMVKEICEGVDGTTMRCGAIGEIGVSWPMTGFEKKSLRAAALAQQRTGLRLALVKKMYLLITVNILAV